MQSNGFSSSADSASSLGADRRDVDVVAGADQLDDRLALGVVVLDDEQVLHAPLDEGGDLVERGLERVAADRLLEVADGARAQHLLAAVGVGHHVHRDVARLGVALEVLEHERAVGDRQLERQQDGVRLVLVRERQALLAAQRDRGP